MHKKYLTLYSLVILFFVFFAGNLEIASTGAPASSTGAPDEKNCTTSGCHDDRTLNGGIGIINIQNNSGSGEYLPNEQYSFTITVEQADIERFGFEVTALDENNEKAGSFVITEADRTQLLDGISPTENREYITYTYTGTEPVATGKGEWAFDWIAPAEAKGEITFYAAALAANNDGTDKGDDAYTTTLNLSPSSATFTREYQQPSCDFYYNSASRSLIFNEMNIKEDWVIEIYNLSGQRLAVFSGREQYYLPEEQYPSGVYIVTAKNSNRQLHQKIFLP